MMRPMLVASLACAMLLVVAMAASSGLQQRPEPAAPVDSYRVVRSYPHDPKAFTQGLVFLDGELYESTGLEGASTLRRVRLENGEVLQVHRLEKRYFAEGIAIWKDRIIQLTYTTGVGFVYDRETFKPLRTFTYKGEGWGLTHDGTRLIMSDGTSFLRFLDPETLAETGRIQVRDAGRPVEQVNELEYIKGEVFANVWGTHRIARIDPRTGRVNRWIDLKGLLDPREARNVDVLNGIAYDADKDRLFVTGKFWPRLFEIVPIPNP
jgi:glutaminyl-peptide cyclotransferase